MHIYKEVINPDGSISTELGDLLAFRDGRWGISQFVGPYNVSTVFLGLDHSFGSGSPVLYETMVFLGSGLQEIFCDRYCTRSEAEAGHEKVLTTWASVYRGNLAAFTEEQVEMMACGSCGKEWGSDLTNCPSCGEPYSVDLLLQILGHGGSADV